MPNGPRIGGYLDRPADLRLLKAWLSLNGLSISSWLRECVARELAEARARMAEASMRDEPDSRDRRGVAGGAP